MALRPEEVKEEGAAEDGGNVDANEDVERSDADVVVVVDVGYGSLVLHEGLLVDVVSKQSVFDGKGIGGSYT